MAQSFIQVPTDSTGKKVDTFITTTAAQHRHVIAIGDKAVDANIAPVDVTKGLAVDLTATGQNTTKLLVTPDLPSGASTAAKQPALGTAGTASADVISVQGIASMTKLLVTPDSVALPANQSVNVNQVAGTATDTNSGNKSAGTQRVVLATDQPALTNKLLVTPDLPSGASTAAKQPALGTAGTASSDVITVQGIASMTKLLVTPDSVALPANQSCNVAQFGGTNVSTGTGASGTGIPRVTVSNDSSIIPLAATSGGLTTHSRLAAASANQDQTNVVSGTHQLYGWALYNTTTSLRYVKIYDATSPTSASTPKLRIPLPGITTGSGSNLMTDLGIPFTTQISYRLTTGVADNDANAVTANDVVVNLFYF